MSMTVSFGLVCHLGISFIIGCVTSMDTCPKGLTTNTSLIHNNCAFIALFQALFININLLGCVSMRAIELIRVPAPLPEHDHDIRARTYGALGWQAGSSCWIHITSSLLNASIPMVMLSTTINFSIISELPESHSVFPFRLLGAIRNPWERTSSVASIATMTHSIPK